MSKRKRRGVVARARDAAAELASRTILSAALATWDRAVAGVDPADRVIVALEVVRRQVGNDTAVPLCRALLERAARDCTDPELREQIEAERARLSQ